MHQEKGNVARMRFIVLRTETKSEASSISSNKIAGRARESASIFPGTQLERLAPASGSSLARLRVHYVPEGAINLP